MGAIFGRRRSRSSGPRRTFRKQKAWDEKHDMLVNERGRLEREREQFEPSAERYSIYTEKLKETKGKLAELNEKLEQCREKRREQEEMLKTAIREKTHAAILTSWKRAANNAIDELVANCPRLDELTSNLAEEYNKKIEELAESFLGEMQKRKEEQCAEKKAKNKKYQEAVETRKKLKQIIDRLDRQKLGEGK